MQKPNRISTKPIIINNSGKLDSKKLEFILSDYDDFHLKISFDFMRECEKNLKKLNEEELSEKEYKDKKQILFDKFISKNNEKYINDFNSRMQKYNIQIIQIKL